MKLKELFLGRKAMTNIDSILKSRNITLPTRVCLVKAMVFLVVIYGCESWTIKLSAEELMFLNCGVGEDSWESLGLQGEPTSPFWRRSALAVLWKEWCWSWNSSTLATSWEEWLIGKDSDAGRHWGQEEKGMTDDEMAGWHHWLDGLESERTPGVGDGQEAWHAAIHRVAKSRTRLSNWTELNWTELSELCWD